MLLLDICKWWYTPGFSVLLKMLQDSFAKTFDRFSFGTLIATLFAPFRQIDAGTTGKSISEKLQAWLSRLISRLIGCLVRLFIFVMGVVVLLVKAVVSVALLVFWPLAPLLPVVFLGCILVGVGT